jgi:hypothetical protein
VVRGTQFPRLSGLLRRFARGRHRIARRLGRLAKDRLKPLRGAGSAAGLGRLP